MSGGIPLRESYDPAKRYRRILWIEERDAQGWSLNEMQDLLDQERRRLGASIWREAGVLQGLSPTVGADGELALSEGIAWLEGRAEPLAAVTLTFPTGTLTDPITPSSTSIGIGADPTTLGFPASGTAYVVAPPDGGAADSFDYSGVDADGFTGVTGLAGSWAAGAQVVLNPSDTVFAEWLLDQITVAEDPLLIEPATGDVVEERYRVTIALGIASPDRCDERFRDWEGGIPRDWTLVSGSCAQGPPKFGDVALKLVHTTGTATQITRKLALAPNTDYVGYFWVRTEAGKTNLTLAHGAALDLTRTSPAWNPTDVPFATTSKWVRQSFSVTADGNTEDVTLRLTIPATAPSTEITVDAILITTAALVTQNDPDGHPQFGELERHYIPLLFWDRATDEISKATPRASYIRMADLVPPLDASTDVVRIPENQEFLDWEAEGTFDEHGHYRVPPGLILTRETLRDTSTHLGVDVSPGRARVRGYRAALTQVEELLVEKAVDYATAPTENKTFAFGSNLPVLNKAAAPSLFPIKSIGAVTGIVERVLSITKGSAGGTDPMGVSVSAIQSVGAGTQGAHAGSQGGPFTFDETTNTLVITVTTPSGGAGSPQTLVFARGTYTRAEVLEALQYGSGRAYRSGKITGNVQFEDSGSAIRVKVRAYGAGHSVIIAANGTSTANTVLGFTAGTYAGSGTVYVLSTDYLVSGDSIDWSPGGAEPGSGTTYYVVVRENKSFAVTTDYVLGGRLSAGTYYYKVAAWGPDGEGIPGSAASRVTVAGEINQIAWDAVPNAVSYHVYRSANGTDYYLLKNVTGTSFTDDGSLTPDTGKSPTTVSTVTTGVLAGGEATVPVNSTTGFPTGGTRTAFIAGSDIFTYTGTSGGNSFTGCSGVSAHASGVTVRVGPDMGPITVALGQLGVINWTPLGTYDPVDGANYAVTYDYYQRRVDRIVLDRTGAVAIVRGVPADEPLAAPMPDDVLELGQVSLEANSTTLVIVNTTLFDRPLVSDLREAMRRVNELYHNDIGQQVLNDIADRDASTTRAKLGLVADGFSNLDGSDTTHPDFAALVDQIVRLCTLPRTISFPALTVNGGQTTAVLTPKGTRYVLPSTQVLLAEQSQWSESINVNPYAVFVPPRARLAVEPPWMSWAVDPTNQLDQWQYQTMLATSLIAYFTTLSQVYPTNPMKPVWLDNIARAQQVMLQAAEAESLGAYIIHAVQLRLDAYQYGPLEDNIAVTFASTPVTASAIPPGTAGTNPGTIKANSEGEWAAQFTVPANIAAGARNIRAKGPVSDATTVFTGMTKIIPPAPTGMWWVDPLSQSFRFDAPVTVSGIELYFTAKSATAPLFVQLRLIENGFPSATGIYTKMVSPSAITADATGATKTTILFDEYFAFPAGQPFTVTLLSTSNEYKVAVARLGQIGKNPIRYITSNPYANGLLFTSSNAQTWTPEQGMDLRFRLLGRSFTSPAVLEFTELSGVDFSDLMLLADQVTPTGTTIAWEYELNGTGVVQQYEPFSYRRLSARASAVKLRARLSTTVASLSPVLTLPTTRLLGALNATSGKWVRIMTEFQNAFRYAQAYAQMSLPSGTGVSWYISKDDGATWAGPLTVASTRVIAENWLEYTYTEHDFGSTGTKFRIRADLSTSTPMAIPLIGQIGVSLRA